MIHALLAAGLAFLSFWIATRVARRLFGKKVGASGGNVHTEVERWAENEIARLSALKLSLDENAVRSTLSGTPDPEIVSSLESHVARAEVVYEKAPQGLSHPELEVRLDLFFEDGSLSRSARKAKWNQVPAFVRAELERTGAAQVFRPYRFPWQHDV